MIKKIMTLLMAFSLPFFASAANYQAGVHYTKVSDTATSKQEVREYFSFYCPHCFTSEPLFATIKKGLPSEAKFERNHVDFLRFTTPEIQFMLTKALAVAKQMDQEEKMVAAIFNYLQVQRATVSSEKDIRNIFVLQGADGAEFDKLYSSFAINSQAKLMQRNQNDLLAKRALTGVPSVIVNGQYRVNPDKLDRNDFQNDYQNLINYLLTLDK